MFAASAVLTLGLGFAAHLGYCPHWLWVLCAAITCGFAMFRGRDEGKSPDVGAASNRDIAGARPISRRGDRHEHSESWWLCCGGREQDDGDPDHFELSTPAALATKCQCATCREGEKHQLDIVRKVHQKYRGAGKAIPDTSNHAAIAAELRAEFSDRSADWVTESTVARLVIKAGGDIEVVKKRARHAIAWNAGTLTSWSRDLAVHPVSDELPGPHIHIAVGEFGRPLLQVCATWQRWGDPAPAHQWACAIDTALKMSPDPMVKLDFLVDTFGFQYSLNLNIVPFLQMARALDSYFAERVHRAVIIDMPGPAEWIWNAVKGVISAKTAAKVKFPRRSDPESMERDLFSLCKDGAMRAHVEAVLKHNTRDCEHQAHYNRDRKKYMTMYRSLVDEHRKLHG